MHPRDDYDTSLRTRRRSMSPPSQSRHHAHTHGGPGHGHGHHGHAHHHYHHHHHHHHGPDRKRLRPSSSIETRLPGDDSGPGPGSGPGHGPVDDGWDREADEPPRRMMMSTSTTKRVGHENSKSRRLYIGNVPFHAGLTDAALTQLFSALYVVGFGGQVPGRALPVVSFWLHADGKFGFMELRGEQETVNMMCFNQTTLHGRVLKVNRPSDFKADIHAPHINQLSMHTVNAKAVVQLCEQLDGLVVPPPHVVAQARQEELSLQAEKTERAAVGGGEDLGRGQAHEEAKDMEVEMDVDDRDGIQKEGDANSTRQSPTPADVNTSGSNAVDRRGPTISGNDTSVQTEGTAEPRDKTEQRQQQQVQQQQQQQSQQQAKVAKPEEEEEEEEDWYEEKSSKAGPVETEVQTESAGGRGQDEDVVVISLQNLVTDKDLAGSEEDFEDIVEDVREECSNYGRVECVEIPRDGPFKGTAFVQFVDADGANSAIEQLADRVFDGRRIIAVGVKGVTTAKEATDSSCVSR